MEHRFARSCEMSGKACMDRVHLDSIGAMHITHGEEAQRLRSWVWRMDGEYLTAFWSGVAG